MERSNRTFKKVPNPASALGQTDPSPPFNERLPVARCGPAAISAALDQGQAVTYQPQFMPTPDLVTAPASLVAPQTPDASLPAFLEGGETDFEADDEGDRLAAAA